jgi:hypothetical protein
MLASLVRGADRVAGELDGSGSFPKDERIAVNGDALEQMGPVDYILVEWPGRQPNGEAMPHLVDLVDRGLIRIIDLTFITKDEDGNVAGLELADLGDVAELAIFEGASSGLIHDDDVATAADVLAPGTSAALLVYENAWAAPFAAAVRRSGGELVASGRIPVEDLLAALDAAEATA